MNDKEEITSANTFSEEEQRSGQDSYATFLQGQFDSCIATLKKIQKNHPGDCKLMHNRAITEFFKSGQTKTGDLKKALSKVHKVTQQSRQEEDDEEEEKDEVASSEYSVLHYNQALLYHFLHQYLESQSLLEPLVNNPDVTHNTREISLLLAEVYLANYEPEKASRLIGKIEEAFLKPTSPQQSKQNTGSDKGKAQKNQNKDVKNSLPLLKARCCLQMKSMKACKRELKAFSNLDGNSDMPAPSIQMLSVFLKSNFEFQRGNFHKAYKLLGSSPPSVTTNAQWLQSGESLMTKFYNNLGVIHFCLSKHSLGSFYMSKALDENDKAISTNPASSTSTKKGESRQQSTASNAKTLQMLNMNKKFELLYNAGIQLLFAGKPSAAFDCLIVAVQVFYSNPRLWLRLAECCIQACCSLDKSEDSTPGSPSRKSKNQSSTLPYSVIGSDIHQKLIVHPMKQTWSGTGNSVMPGPTLEFASVCLQNALTILAEAGISGIDMVEGKKNSKSDTSNKKTEVSISCFPTGPLSGLDLAHLHASILANSAFVALSLGNNLMAYEYSKVLLQLTNLSHRHRYLGKMYSAEALVSLDRISDAIQHLSSDTVTNLSDSYGDSCNTKSQSNSDDPSNQAIHKPRGPSTTQCCFKSIQHAQGCMILNQALSHSLRSEFEKALRLISQFAVLVPQQDVPPNAILLAVYVHLHTNGGLPVALKILQHNSLPSHSNTLAHAQTCFRPQQPASAAGAKHYSSVASSPNGMSSNGSSVSGGSSSGSRSKSSTPQPQYSNPPSGSVTPERVLKSSQSSSKSDSGGSKTKRGRR